MSKKYEFLGTEATLLDFPLHSLTIQINLGFTFACIHFLQKVFYGKKKVTKQKDKTKLEGQCLRKLGDKKCQSNLFC